LLIVVSADGTVVVLLADGTVPMRAALEIGIGYKYCESRSCLRL
jgi:hypothetical protein